MRRGDSPGRGIDRLGGVGGPVYVPRGRFEIRPRDRNLLRREADTAVRSLSRSRPIRPAESSCVRSAPDGAARLLTRIYRTGKLPHARRPCRVRDNRGRWPSSSDKAELGSATRRIPYHRPDRGPRREAGSRCIAVLANQAARRKMTRAPWLRTRGRAEGAKADRSVAVLSAGHDRTGSESHNGCRGALPAHRHRRSRLAL